MGTSTASFPKYSSNIQGLHQGKSSQHKGKWFFVNVWSNIHKFYNNESSHETLLTSSKNLHTLLWNHNPKVNKANTALPSLQIQTWRCEILNYWPMYILSVRGSGRNNTQQIQG